MQIEALKGLTRIKEMYGEENISSDPRRRDNAPSSAFSDFVPLTAGNHER